MYRPPRGSPSFLSFYFYFTFFCFLFIDMPETCSMISWYLRKIPVTADLFVPFYRLFQLSVAFSMQRKTSARGDEGMCGEAMREGHDARGFGLHGRTTDAVGHGAALGPGEVEGDTALLRRLEVHGGWSSMASDCQRRGGTGWPWNRGRC